MKQSDLNNFYLGFEHFFPEGSPPVDTPLLKWRSRKEFTDEVKGYTKIDISKGNPKAIKDSQIALAKLVTNAEKEDANRPSKEQLATLEKEEEERVAKQKEAAENAKRNVETAIKRQEEIRESLKNKKIYAKVETPEPPPIQNTKQIETLRAAAKSSPKSFEEDLYPKIKASIEPSLKASMSSQEIDFLARKVAYDTTRGLSDSGTQQTLNIQSAILERVGSFSPEIAEAAGVIRFAQNSPISRNIVTAINPDLAAAAFGPDPGEYKVSFSNTPIPGGSTIEPYQVSQSYSQLLHNESAFFDNVRGFGQGQAKNFLMGQARVWLDGRVASLSPEISGFYNSTIVQESLGFMGFGEPIAFGETWFGEIVLKIPGATPFFEGLGNSLGIDFIGGAGAGAAVPVAEAASAAVGAEVATGGVGVAAGEAVGTAAGVAAGEAAGTATGAAAGAAAGSVVPVAGTIIGAIGGFLVGLLGPKAIGFLKDNAKNIGMVSIGIMGAGIGFVLGGGSILFALAGGAFGAGVASVASGGVSGLASTASSFASTVGAGVGVVWATFLAGVGVPLVAILIGFPVVVAIILVIINSGAYLVPPGTGFLNSTNPYIQVEKTANPSGAAASPQSVTYTVTITAKKDTLTGISFKSDCKAIRKSGSALDCKGLEKIPAAPSVITPGTPFSFTFTSNYDSKYQNSLVSDTFAVSAKSNEGGKVSETGSATICFGDCPLNCFNTVDTNEKWPSNFKASLDAAAATLGSIYPGFAAKVCAGGPVNLCYTTKDPNPLGYAGLCNGAIFARHIHTPGCDVNFNQCGLRSETDSLFILTHEVTHHLQKINGSYLQKFVERVPTSEWLICTYEATDGNEYESMAEGNGLYVALPSWNHCISKYLSQYPKHYQFAKSVMFAP